MLSLYYSSLFLILFYMWIRTQSISVESERKGPFSCPYRPWFYHHDFIYHGFTDHDFIDHGFIDRVLQINQHLLGDMVNIMLTAFTFPGLFFHLAPNLGWNHFFLIFVNSTLMQNQTNDHLANRLVWLTLCSVALWVNLSSCRIILIWPVWPQWSPGG